jgi:hypothetical protein
MVIRKRPGLALYHYLIHPEFGWMFAHIQTWFPFAIHIYVDGREWLARQMDKEKLAYVRQDNCFPWIGDYGRAQQLLDEQLKTNWEACLRPFAQRLNPLHQEIFAKFNTNYYWTVPQCEWATDIVFKPGALESLTPRFLEHGMLSFSSPDVMQFLGKKIRLDGHIPEGFDGELTTDFKRRKTGERIKHRLNGNSLKCYGKAHTPVGELLRVETTTNRVEEFHTFRPKEGGPADDLQWRLMRRGVADLHRRAEVSQKANERYLNALSTVDDSTRLSEDHALLKAVNRGEFALNGLRNRDLQALLYKPGALPPAEKRRRRARVSRQLRLLRAHGLIQKVPRTHRYQVTATGRLIITAILTADRTSLSQLNKLAA